MARGDDLSTPKGTSGGPSYNPDQFGAIAERLARFFGTPRYLIMQTAIVIVWIAFNAYVALNYGKNHAFDPYPFILLNLAFSTQAAYAAPLILLAQNRQADRDKAEVERDRETNARSLAETEYLAREIAAVRLAVDHKADRDEIFEVLERLTQAVERLQPADDRRRGHRRRGRLGTRPGREGAPRVVWWSGADARSDGLLDPRAEIGVDVLPVLERAHEHLVGHRVRQVAGDV